MGLRLGPLIIGLAAALVATGVILPVIDSQPQPTLTFYGPGLNIDGKGNSRVGGGDLQSVSYRFKASTTSRVESVSWELRRGPGYSSGGGGVLRISLQSDDGSRDHAPSGTILGSTTFKPGSEPAGGVKVRTPLPEPLLQAGEIYHLVFENISNDPEKNWVSVNALYTAEKLNPRQPNPDFAGIFALLTRWDDSQWVVDDYHTPHMDIAYKNGSHDGLAYSQALYNSNSADDEIVAEISGQEKAREIFTVTGGNVKASRATVRVARDFGSEPLKVALEDDEGVTLAAGEVDADDIPRYAADDDYYDGSGPDEPNGKWVTASFPSLVTLRNGSTYHLVISTGPSSGYAMVPIRYRDWNAVQHHSWAFRQGKAQAGYGASPGTWEDVYKFQEHNNLQWYVSS